MHDINPDMKETIKEKAEAFQFKQFMVAQDQCTMKVGTDGVLLGAWSCLEDAKKILDIGTGCGVIAIMLAQRTQDAIVHGIEIEEVSYLQAASNMKTSRWNKRMKAIHAPIQDYAKRSQEEYDLIVSNPPFFSGGTFSSNENRTNVRHAIKLPHGDLLSAARKLMSKNGKLCLILPLIEGLRIKQLAKNYRLYCTKITEVKSRPGLSTERLLMQFEKDETKALQEDELLVYAGIKGKAYSPAYIELTKAFYLKM